MWLQGQLKLEEIHPQSGVVFVQANVEIKLGKPLKLVRVLSLRIGRTLERLIRRVRMPKALKFITISFFQKEPWLFVITAEIRRDLVLLSIFHLLELKIKNFGSLSMR